MVTRSCTGPMRILQRMTQKTPLMDDQLLMPLTAASAAACGPAEAIPEMDTILAPVAAIDPTHLR